MKIYFNESERRLFQILKDAIDNLTEEQDNEESFCFNNQNIDEASELSEEYISNFIKILDESINQEELEDDNDDYDILVDQLFHFAGVIDEVIKKQNILEQKIVSLQKKIEKDQ